MSTAREGVNDRNKELNPMTLQSTTPDATLSILEEALLGQLHQKKTSPAACNEQQYGIVSKVEMEDAV